MQARKPFQAASRYPQVEYRQPKNLIAALQGAVKTMNHAEIRTVEALLVRVAGDFVAGMVLHRLLAWLPFSKRKDGVIWKSDRDWQCEMGLSYAQMARCREVLDGLVKSVVKRAQGSPTYHYQIDADVLLRKIAEVYGVTLLFVKVLIFEKVEVPFSRKSNMEVRESLSSIFEKVEKPEQQQLQHNQQQEPQQKVQTAFFLPAVIDLKTANLWDAVKNQLEHQLDRATWKYVKGAVGELRGDELVLRGTHPHDLLRASRNIAKVASSIANKTITVKVEE